MRISWIAVAALLCAGPVAAAEATPSPVLVELFTAQGCSSCPPADAILARLAQRTDMVALAFHVDYWDSTGWTDRLSIPAAMARQRAYAAMLHRQQVYTPQMMIDGTIDLPGNDPAAVVAALNAAREKKPAGPALTLTAHGGQISIVVSESANAGDAAIWAAAYDPQQTIEVKRGENRGRTIVNANIVRQLRTIGRYGGPSWSSEVDRASLAMPEQGIAVWVQPAGLGAVQAAAFLPPAQN